MAEYHRSSRGDAQQGEVSSLCTHRKGRASAKCGSLEDLFKVANSAYSFDVSSVQIHHLPFLVIFILLMTESIKTTSTEKDNTAYWLQWLFQLCVVYNCHTNASKWSKWMWHVDRIYAGPCFNKNNIASAGIRIPIMKIIRSKVLYYGNPYNGKTVSLDNIAQNFIKVTRKGACH